MMNKGKRQILIAVIALVMVIALILSACAQPSPTPTEKPPIPIGFAASVTGPAATMGVPMINAAEDWVHKVNESGGIEGHPVELTWYDDAYDAAKMASNYKRLRDEGNLLIVCMGSKPASVLRPLADSDGIPIVSIYYAPTNICPPGHLYCAHACYSDGFGVLANWIMESWEESRPPRIVLHGQDNPIGWSTVQASWALAEQIGVEVISEEFHELETISEVASLTRIKGMNPDFLYITSMVQSGAIIIKDATRVGLSDVCTIVVNEAASWEQLIELSGTEVAEGVYGQNVVVPWGTDVPGMKEMLEWNQKYSKQVSSNQYTMTWAAFLGIEEALKQAVRNVGYDSLTPQTVEEQGIQKVKDFDTGGISGKIDWTDDYDRRGAKVMLMLQIQDGKWVAVSDWTDCPVVHYEEYEWFGK